MNVGLNITFKKIKYRFFLKKKKKNYINIAVLLYYLQSELDKKS